MAEWIGDVLFDDSVAFKIQANHGLTAAEVRLAVCWGAAESMRWDDDDERGSRLLVIGRIGEVRIKVVLLPVDIADGTWRCKTAMRATR